LNSDKGNLDFLKFFIPP